MKTICNDLADLKKALYKKNGLVSRPCAHCETILDGCLPDDEPPVCQSCAESLCKTCNGYGSYFEDVAGDGGSRMEIPCDDCYTENE